MVKRVLVLISMVLIQINGLCQNDSILGSFTAVGTPPVFSTKGDSIELFIKRNLEYPMDALEAGVEGEVIISFYIDTVGNAVNHKLIRGLTEELNIEALRIANLIRFEKPAMQNGKPISVIYFIKIEFELPCTIKTNKSLGIFRSFLLYKPSFFAQFSNLLIGEIFKPAFVVDLNVVNLFIFGYDGYGNVLTESYPNSITTRNTWDQKGFLEKISLSSNNFVLWQYVSSGGLIFIRSDGTSGCC